MRLTRRIHSLERRAASGTGCPVCKGAGWPTVRVAGAPPEARPRCWPAGCRSCGRVMLTSWISIGPSPTAEEARAFMEAV